MRAIALQLASSGDTSENLLRIRQLVDDSLTQPTDLVVLPEASQRCFGSSGELLAGNAETLEGPFVSMLVDLAMSHNTTVAAGMFELNQDIQRPFNTTVVVNRDGILAKYRKIHLYDAFGFCESDGVTPGSTEDDNIVVVPIGDTKVGIMTCFDLRFPEMAMALLDHGATVLAIGAAWLPGERKVEQWNALLMARAIESTCFVVAAAQPAPRYCGMSQLIHPDGHVMAQAGPEGSSSLSEELLVGELEAVRTRMPVEDIRKGTTEGRP